MRAYRKSRKELDELATQVVRREVHIATHGPELEHSFGFILTAAMAEKPPKSGVESIGAVYERMAKASPTGINGLPFFFSCQFVHVKDMKRLRKLILRKERALEDRSLLARLYTRRFTASGKVA